jgi:hypothetical protein
MSETTPKRKRYSIEFTSDAAKALKDMAEEDNTTAAELVRRAVNFYQVKLEAKREHKRILLEREDGVKEWVMI